MRKTLQEIDPNVPLYNVSTLESQLDDSLSRDRLITWLSTAFGVLATLLATMGLYGVIAFSVAQRTREIGIRMALGAQRFDVLRLVLQQVAFLVLGGLALGTFISLGGIRAVGSLLYGIEATDPFAFLGAAAVLLVAAALAAFSPARRATHVNPTVALRYEWLVPRSQLASHNARAKRQAVPRPAVHATNPGQLLKTPDEHYNCHVCARDTRHYQADFALPCRAII